MELAASGDTYTIHVDGETWARFSLPRLGDQLPEVEINDAGDGWQRVTLTWGLDEPLAQDELAITFQLDMAPDFWWAPHLAPRPDTCIAQHVFRSPALIAAQQEKTLVVVPDLDLCGQQSTTTVPLDLDMHGHHFQGRQLVNPCFMDVSAPDRTWWLGIGQTKITRHVEYEKTSGMVFAPGTVALGFYMLVYVDEEEVRNPWSRVTRFLWDHYGRPLLKRGEPLNVTMERYVEHVYTWAFEAWEDAVWQEFDLDQQHVGAPAFIVNVTQSPNYPGEVNLREFLSVWNQAWFSSLRSASGVYRYAQRTQNNNLFRRADMTKAFALAAPMKDGIFPSVYRTEMTEMDIEGKTYRRSAGWETGYWTNSNRSPREQGITDAWYHVLDASWTALLMLRWYDELDPDPKLLAYAKAYADKLLSLQDEAGFFPAWLDPETLAPTDVLSQSPETSMSVTFLLKLFTITGEPRYRQAALKAMDAVLMEIVPEGRWEDFETYWSCCSFGREAYVERKIPRNAMYKQCNFSMFWTAEALLAAYRETANQRYLDWGKRTLDELSMTQQVWQPPFIYIPALGGFGVMNFDGEWNDSRQCLFAELFMDYYHETGDARLFERGIVALKAAFVMMYCPENPEAKALWEKVWTFFGPEDYGFTMENYGHVGFASPEGGGVGEFTIYDWGNGAAAEARNRIRDHYGDVYIDRKRGQGFGIDSVGVVVDGNTYRLTDQTGTGREIRVAFDDGTTRDVQLDPADPVVLS